MNKENSSVEEMTISNVLKFMIANDMLHLSQPFHIALHFSDLANKER